MMWYGLVWISACVITYYGCVIGSRLVKTRKERLAMKQAKDVKKWLKDRGIE